VYKFYIALFLLADVLSSCKALADETLNVGVLIASKGQRAAYYQLATQFEQQHPSIRINYVVKGDRQYKNAMGVWLNQAQGLDVLYWQAGNRLNQFASQGLLEPLNELWREQNWQQHFPQGIQDTIRQNNTIYGLPFSYYQWGFYYKKSLFSRLKLKAPSSWGEFLAVCETLKSNGVIPIVVSGKDSWPVAAWFDYLNLRINGIAFHQQLMKGQIPYTDQRVRALFNTWKQLIDLGYFAPTIDNRNWQGALPYVYRDIAGMTLLGNFVEKHIAKVRSDDIAFFRFPQINVDMPLYEETPIEVFIIPKNAQHKQAAKQFLSFVGRPEVQEKLNQTLGYISPHLQAGKGSHYRPELGSKMIGNTNGLTQFFDRDTAALMSLDGIKIMSNFLTNVDVDITTQNLENVRLRAYPNANTTH
tara:strand:- start:2130 stop:3377 length:1248 start_codon:yes stop_codon:yes gene_type:complete